MQGNAVRVGLPYMLNPGAGKCRLTVVIQTNNTIISNNTRINSVFHGLTTVSVCWPALAHPSKAEYNKDIVKQTETEKLSLAGAAETNTNGGP